MTGIAAARALVARDARPTDNAALIELAAACPMVGDFTLCVDRAPDFFALNRLEGDSWRVGVVDGTAGTPVGCIATSERIVYLHGGPARSAYVGDLKVHPAHRGGGGAVADALTCYARDAALAAGGPGVPTLLTVLAGNRPMERRAAGPRGLPHLARFATIRSYALPLLWPRLERPGLRVTAGDARDLEAMAALWRRVAPGRNFAPVYAPDSLGQWIGAAPGLDFSCYRLAWRRDGRLAGFLALWDQSSFKQLRVVRYSSRAGAVRFFFNRVAPLCAAAPLPVAGAPLRYVTALHVCAEDASALRALLMHAHDALRGRGLAFFAVGLDVRDPLAVALSGLFAQPTDVHAYVTAPAGRYGGPRLDARPLHYEIALV
ncbi:MAG TPA: hypothetical protein VFU41_13410 [Gemmatimonadales bacterium]|nr:hypothetical protein [Gemmatimonadales bacterium]